MAYLGEYSERIHTANGQRFRLIVPERADLREQPTALFNSLSAASDQLRVGNRDEEVVMIATPTANIDWGIRGLQSGPAEGTVGFTRDGALFDSNIVRLDSTTGAEVEATIQLDGLGSYRFGLRNSTETALVDVEPVPGNESTETDNLSGDDSTSDDDSGESTEDDSPPDDEASETDERAAGGETESADESGDGNAFGPVGGASRLRRRSRCG